MGQNSCTLTDRWVGLYLHISILEYVDEHQRCPAASCELNFDANGLHAFTLCLVGFFEMENIVDGDVGKPLLRLLRS
jgi:hypothetical protein